ncbi:MAG: hypothetical protein H7067_16290, partial [Burkholderiales bacterium]|nr:hypothetical protein [Opitutaceae bacterium]
MSCRSPMQSARFILPLLAYAFLALATSPATSAPAASASPAAASAATSAADLHPFPHDHTYAHGIRPSAFSQAQMNADLVTMWQAWRKTDLLSEGAAPGELRVTMGGPR